MRATIVAVAVAGLVALAGCGKRSDPVGENSTGSVRTTAVGTIVGTEPRPTPTADATGATPGLDNAAAVDGNDAGDE